MQKRKTVFKIFLYVELSKVNDTIASHFKLQYLWYIVCIAYGL